jgi:hypothetical protein
MKRKKEKGWRIKSNLAGGDDNLVPFSLSVWTRQTSRRFSCFCVCDSRLPGPQTAHTPEEPKEPKEQRGYKSNSCTWINKWRKRQIGPLIRCEPAPFFDGKEETVRLAGWPAGRPISRDQHSSASSVESSTNSRTAGRPPPLASSRRPFSLGLQTTLLRWATRSGNPYMGLAPSALHRYIPRY